MHEVGRPQRSGGVGVAPRRADSVVIFGVTGDLVSKKIFPALYELARRDRLDRPVVGVGRTAWSTDELIAAARGSVLRAKGLLDEDAFGRLARRLTMVAGNYADRTVYSDIVDVPGEARLPVLYLATPPSVFPPSLTAWVGPAWPRVAEPSWRSPSGATLLPPGASTPL